MEEACAIFILFEMNFEILIPNAVHGYKQRGQSVAPQITIF